MPPARLLTLAACVATALAAGSKDDACVVGGEGPLWLAVGGSPRFAAADNVTRVQAAGDTP